MAIFLPTTREILDLPTSTESNIFRMTHLGTVLGFQFEPVAEMEMTVEGGDVFSGRRGVKSISSVITRDELGRPIEEVVVNEDKGETTTRRWEYTSPYDAREYTSWIEETGEGLQSNRVVGEGRIQAHRNGRDFFVDQAVNLRGHTQQILSDPDDQILEMATFDKEGRLVERILVGEDRTTKVSYRHDEEGRVRSAISGSITPGVDVRQQENMTLVTYLPTFVNVRSYVGMTVANSNVVIVRNEKDQPVSIVETSGFAETGQRTIKASVKYHEPVTV